MTNNTPHTITNPIFPPNNWIETTLGEIGKTITGKTPSKDNPEDWGDYMVFITPTDLKGDSKFIENTARKLSTDGIKRFSKMIIPKNSIIVTCIGSDMGKVVINKNDCLTNQQINSLVIGKDFDVDFIYYKLKDSYSILKSRADGGSTMPILNKSNFESLQFLFPPLPEQQAIASVLSAFDDKIELLREQNKTLEEVGQTIFQEWFGKYEVGDELPEGWRVGKIEDIFDFLEGPGIRNWQYTDDGTRFINIRLIQNGDILVENSNFVSDEEAYGKYKHFMLQERDFVLSTSGTLGRGAIVRKEHLPLMLNTSVIRFRPKDKISYGFMYLFLQSSFFIHELESLASGSVQLNFGPMHLRQIEMIIPSSQILKNFTEAVKPIFEKIADNFSQIQSLAHSRDELLPRLMSGEVRVKF
jgi:type I restriction enzyme S subunit